MITRCSICGARLGRHAYLTILGAYADSPRAVLTCEATDRKHDPSGSYSLPLNADDPADTADSVWHLGEKDWALPIIGDIGAVIACWWASLDSPPEQRRAVR